MLGKAKTLCFVLVAVVAWGVTVVGSAQAGAIVTGQQAQQLNFKLTGSGAETKCTQRLSKAQPKVASKTLRQPPS